VAESVWKALQNWLGGSASEKSEESASGWYVIAGLGNPGPAYEKTRHNVGFEVIDRLAEMLGASAEKKKFGARIAEAQTDGRKVLLVKPETFMNRSGQPIATVMGFYRLGLERLLVITDDAALEPGRIRIRPKGSAGGHKGLADIIEKLKSEEFARLRVGIGSCPGERMVEYVLSRPPAPERALLEEAIRKAAEAALCWVREGLQEAMNRYNSRDTAGSSEKTEPGENESGKHGQNKNP
jgi:PTH1 family peptidyl-tRNA hydrolase